MQRVSSMKKLDKEYSCIGTMDASVCRDVGGVEFGRPVVSG